MSDRRGTMAAGRLIMVAVLTACSETAPALGDPSTVLELSLVEQSRIDGHGADLVPIPPGGVIITGDNSIAVLQPQDFAIRLFAATGLEGRPIGGRAGAGPGEFGHTTGFGLLGDTLWVWDGRLERIQLFGPDREYSGTMNVRLGRQVNTVSGVTFSAASPGALYRDGSVLAYGTIAGEWALVRVSASGLPDRIISYIARHDDFRTVRTAQGVAEGNPFGLQPLYTIAPDGSRIAVLRANMEGPSAGTFSIQMIGADGDTLYDRTYSFEPVPIPSSVVDSAIDAGAAALGGDLAAAYRRDAYIPPFYPPVTSLTLGSGGELWIRLRTSQGRRTYLVLNPDGDVIGRVYVSPNISVAAVAGHSVWALERDTYGVQNIVGYRVEPFVNP